MVGPTPATTLSAAEVSAWLERSRDPDERVRMRAVQHLCPCHTKANRREVWDRVIELLADPARRVRTHALHAVGDGSPREYEARIVAALEQRYQDPDRKLRRGVRKLLAHYRRTGELNVL